MTDKNPSEFAQRAAGVARNIDPGSSSGCFICQQKLFVQFFFDGFGHTVDEDEKEGLMSNVAKLYKAAAVVADMDRGIHTAYVDGPGTPLKTRVDAKRTLSGRAAGEIAIAPTNMVSEVGESAAKHAAGGHNPLRALSPSSLKGGLVSAVIEGLFGWAAEANPRVRDFKPAAFLAQTGYDARLAYAHSRLTQIVNSQRLRVKEIHIAVYGADRGATLARAFVNQLIQASHKNHANPDAVYFPTGNGPARVFFRFMGLFDASSSLGKLTGLGVFMLRNDAGDVFKLLVPKQVECCVHLTAAHEFRHMAPLHSIGTVPKDVAAWLEEQAKKEKSKADAARTMRRWQSQPGPEGASQPLLTNYEAEARQAEWTALELRARAIRLNKTEGVRIEKLYAGAQPNVVGGGYKDGEGGKCDELSKLPLREMHKQAFLNGCPLPSMAQLSSDAKLAKNFKLRPLFQLANGAKATIEDLHRAYMAGKPSDVSVAAMEAHATAYMHWLHGRLIALDAMPPAQRAGMHELKQNIPLSVSLDCKRIKGDPTKFQTPQPISATERRVFDAFDQGGTLSEECRRLFDECVYTPVMSGYFSPRAIDVTEDDSPEGKQFQQQQDDKAKQKRDQEKRAQEQKDEEARVLRKQRLEAEAFQRTQSRWPR